MVIKKFASHKILDLKFADPVVSIFLCKAISVSFGKSWACRKSARLAISQSLTVAVCHSLSPGKELVMMMMIFYQCVLLPYSASRLTVATHQTFFFLQVSQSGYPNLINGHASLQSPTVK